RHVRAGLLIGDRREIDGLRLPFGVLYWKSQLRLLNHPFINSIPRVGQEEPGVAGALGIVESDAAKADGESVGRGLDHRAADRRDRHQIGLVGWMGERLALGEFSFTFSEHAGPLAWFAIGGRRHARPESADEFKRQSVLERLKF